MLLLLEYFIAGIVLASIITLMILLLPLMICVTAIAAIICIVSACIYNVRRAK